MYEPNLAYKIRGSLFDIYNNIVGSWSEVDYEDILFDVLASSGLNVERQKEFIVYYKGNKVGFYKTDLIVEDKIILELKAVPEVFPLHEAQTISYLKVTGLKLAMLINFGGAELFIKIYPNKFVTTTRIEHKEELKRTTGIYYKEEYLDDVVSRSFEKRLRIDFDIEKANLSYEDKILIKPFLEISKDILEILGPGFFHQVYRRAFWDELKYRDINFEWIKQLELSYKGKIYNQKEVRFFKIKNLLISIVAVKELDKLIITKFFKFVKYYKCDSGLIVNFNNTMMDFRFIKTGITRI